MLKNLNIISEVGAAVVVVLFFAKAKFKLSGFNVLNALVLLFLVATTCFELSSRYYAGTTTATAINNITCLFIFLCNAVLYRTILKPHKLNIVITILSLSYLFYWLYEMLFAQHFHKTIIPIYAFSSDILLIFGFLFFVVAFSKTPLLQNKYYAFGFWYSIGLIIFNAGVTVCFSLLNYCKQNHIFLLNLPVYNTIPKLLCIVLYGALIIALVKWNK